MADERERAELQRHIQEAEERAAAGGHRLAPWRRVNQTGLFVSETTCTRCGEKVQAGYTTLLVAFARDCPGMGEG
ncbi:MAG: hypothetical protein IPM39_09530 [Chloroflexi bacterium]|nr:hypothetical protein [Chloroflexota bacterium]